MKIAVGIVGILLGMLALLQSCAVTVGSSLTHDQATGGSASIGVLVGFLYFVAGAFAFGLPLVSAIIFGVAALLAFLGASQGNFGDIGIWGGVGIVLAIGAFFAWRSGKNAVVQSNI